MYSDPALGDDASVEMVVSPASSSSSGGFAHLGGPSSIRKLSARGSIRMMPVVGEEDEGDVNQASHRDVWPKKSQSMDPRNVPHRGRPPRGAMAPGRARSLHSMQGVSGEHGLQLASLSHTPRDPKLAQATLSPIEASKAGRKRLPRRRSSRSKPDSPVPWQQDGNTSRVTARALPPMGGNRESVVRESRGSAFVCGVLAHLNSPWCTAG